jgi:CO/xanthine dehydrogenase FAD-binding subunit
MIAADFAYYQPQTLQELPDALAQAGGDPYFFYAGGSEILSMARAGSIAPQAVIDVKALADLRRIRTENQTLILGAAATSANCRKRIFYAPGFRRLLDRRSTISAA